MYLSKLELHGFKSFADRTTVDFADGVTVVVGPNGCGKSNIVDAVRWVIGEQRARILRSDKMDSVIFNGTSKRRALGMAEVLLTIENTRGILPTEYSEVTIGRRLFRSGESEYIMNGVNCRLKDITDLFMDTGMGAGAYSVIELKMIEEILSDNAADRRHLFEEAAGITKYKIRRGQTLRKLKSTQGDLNRVRDLTDELDKRVRSLERQAQKAARFKKYDERLHHLEVSLGLLEYRKLSADIELVQKDMGKLTDAAAAFTAKLAAEEAAHESLRTEHVNREKGVVHAQSLLTEHMDALRAAESDLRVATERLSTISRDLTRLDEEAKAAIGQRENFESDLERYEKEYNDVVPAAEKAEAELSDAKRIRDEAQTTQQKHQVKLHNLRLQERKVSSEKADMQRQIDRLSSRIEITTVDLEETRSALEHHDSTTVDLDAEVQAAATALETARNAASAARDALRGLEEEKNRLESEWNELQGTLRRLERSHDGAASEVRLLEGLLSSYEDLSESVQYLANTPGWSDSDLLTLADVIRCEDAVAGAVQAAMGDLSSCIVVATEDEAARAVANLRKDEKGRATFLILDKLRAPGIPSAPAGATSLASLVEPIDLVYQTLVDLVFGSTFLVDTLENASVDEGVRLVTPSGEWRDAHGYLHAGSGDATSSGSATRMGRREQLERARVELNAAASVLRETEKKRDALRDAMGAVLLSDAKEAVRAADRVLLDAERMQSRMSASADMAGGRAKELNDRIGTQERTLTQAQADLEKASASVKTLTLQEADMQQKRTDAEEAFAGIEEASRKAFSLFNEANITAVQARNRMDNLKRELTRVRADLETLTRRAEERKGATEQLLKQRQELQTRCNELQETIQERQKGRLELDEAVSAAKERLMETKVEISELEARLRELRRERESAMRGESDRAVRRAELETRLEDLLASFDEDHELDLKTLIWEIPEDFDRKEARSEVQDLKNKIRHLGPVNALALESFEEEKERLTFMNEQLEDLISAESTLMTTIDEINTTARQRFDETFNAIRENFRKLFEDLFGEGASADIELQDDHDPLESDVNIYAKPRGKKPSVLSQLSGGEKTLTAIALLFAIYLVKPSPFCILDEVDAPLDDANVDRFMHLIRTFSDSTQFILVTHNKRTMEAADRMYGITMAEQGVSKLVGVKFEAEEESEEVEAA